MGKRDRLRKAKVIDSTEPMIQHTKSVPPTMLQCKLCKVLIPNYRTEEHKKVCKGRR